MARETAVRSNIEIVRGYTQAVFNVTEEWAGDDLAAIVYQVGAYTPPWLSGPS